MSPRSWRSSRPPHAGNTTAEFEQAVKAWVATAKDPKTGRRYIEMVYQQVLEVLAYLRAHSFKTYIVSGGGVEFMRPWVGRVYGVSPEQVVDIKREWARIFP